LRRTSPRRNVPIPAEWLLCGIDTMSPTTSGPCEIDDIGSTAKNNPTNTSQGFLLMNADDWGRDRQTTDRILDCCANGSVSSASAMVFMEDSERAAVLALEHGLEVGLHLNFTTPFSASVCSTALIEHQQRTARHLLRHRLSQAVFHPGLVRSFEYLVKAQLDEFQRIYQKDPAKIDGHHHMHLCANVMLQGLLPPGFIVRRSFSFEVGEKSFWNRAYRKLMDRTLSRRHRLPDFFFSLPPLEPPQRLERIYSLARQCTVELETHPINADEYRYLMSGEMLRHTSNLRIAGPSALAQ